MGELKTSLKLDIDDRMFKSSLNNAINDLRKLDSATIKHKSTIRSMAHIKNKDLQFQKRKIALMRQEKTMLKKLQSEERKRMSLQRKLHKFGGGVMGQLGMVGGGLGLAYGAVQMTKGTFNRQAQKGQIENMLGRGLSDTEVSKMEQLALKTGQSLEGVLESMYSALSTKGFDFNKALSATNTSGKLATSGNSDIATSSSAVISFMQAFSGMTDKKAGDLLTGTVKGARATLGEIAEYSPKFLKMFEASGGKVEDALAMFSGITNVMPNVAESSTAMNAFVKALSKADPNKEGLGKFGISSKDLRSGDLFSILKKIKDVIDKDKDNKDLILSQMFPEMEAKKAIIPFLNNLDLFTSSREKVVSGNLNENFLRNTDKANVNLERLSSATKILSDAFWSNETIMGGFSQGLENLTYILNGFKTPEEVERDFNTKKVKDKELETAFNLASNPEKLTDIKNKIINGEKITPLDELANSIASQGGKENFLENFRRLRGVDIYGAGANNKSDEELSKKNMLDTASLESQLKDSLHDALVSPSDLAGQSLDRFTRDLNKVSIILNDFAFVGPQQENASDKPTR